jgi:hypothetical protein
LNGEKFGTIISIWWYVWCITKLKGELI